MMPPCVHNSAPPVGEVLAQGLLVLNGNTLSRMTHENLSVRTTGWFSRALEFQFEGEHEMVGESDDPHPIPGTFQEVSTLRIRLVNPPKSKKLQVRLIDSGQELWVGTYRTAR